MLAQKELYRIRNEGLCAARVFEWEEILSRLKKPIVLNSPLSLHLIRHGESQGNASKLITGAKDVPLTALGEAQAACLSEKLDTHYDLAITSKLQRAKKTLEIATSNGNIQTQRFITDERLNERCLGVLEGQEFRWIQEYSTGDLHYAPFHGETYLRVSQRIFSFLIDLTDEAMRSNLTKVLISSHMGPMRIMVGIAQQSKDSAHVLGLSFSNTEVVRLSLKSLEIPGFITDYL